MGTTAPVGVGDRPFAAFLVSRRFVALWSLAIALFFFGFATRWTFDPWTIGNYWPGHFFSAQADAMLHGRLWVDPVDLPGECIRLNGHCYGYFGIPPSVVRLPLVLLVGVQRSEMTGLFLAVAAGIATWSALDLCRRVLEREGAAVDRWSAGYMAVAAVVLGPGSSLLLVSDPYVYQEAILWSVAAAVLGVNLFWRWWSERRDRQFIGATIAIVVAAGSRPSAVFVGAVLAVAVVARCLRTGRISRHAAIGAAGLALLPILVVVGAFYAKFGAPLPPDEGYQGLDYEYVQQIVKNNGGESGASIRYAPTEAVAYLRPDALRLSSDWPWFRFRFGRPIGDGPMERISYLPPLARDSLNVERTVSITDVMPVPLVATIAAVVVILRRRRQRYELALLAALATMPLVVLTTITVASRYLGDFFPLLAVGTAFGAAAVGRLRAWSPTVRTLVVVPVLLLTVLSIPVVTSLATRYDWIYRDGGGIQ